MKIKTIIASEVAALDSDVHTGGGTDSTEALQAALDEAFGKLVGNHGLGHFVPLPCGGTYPQTGSSGDSYGFRSSLNGGKSFSFGLISTRTAGPSSVNWKGTPSTGTAACWRSSRRSSPTSGATFTITEPSETEYLNKKGVCYR